MIDYVGLIREFSLKYGHYIGNLDSMPPDGVVKLRMRLIDEENQEFKGAALYLNHEHIAKELADLLYVVFGAALAFGIPIDEVFKEVHRSNMTKSKVKDLEGKTLKGDKYSPPDLHTILYGKEDGGTDSVV